MAVFLSRIAGKRLASAVRPVVELLSGIPSVVYGLIGMIVLVPMVMQLFSIKSGTTLFPAIVVLAVMILPSVDHQLWDHYRASHNAEGLMYPAASLVQR